MAYLDDVYAVVQIQPTGVETFVRLSQNENGRKLYFAIQGGELPSGSTATISGTKPDGVVYSASATISGNTVTVNEDIQLTAVAGAWPAKLRILNGGQVIATGRIRFVIDADPVAPGSVPSDSELEGLVAEAAEYAEAAKNAAYYGSPLVASTVAGMTDHTRVYVYTGSESGYTNGNWYYWNGSAWTSGGVYNAQGISTDPTLTISGKAADSKATGDRLTAAENDISDVKSDLTQISESVMEVVQNESEARTAADNALRSDINDGLADLQAQISSVYGAPLTAETVAEMTDHRKAYVYTGEESGYIAGNWYYWNGSAWVSGGVYNAVAVETDKTLTIEGMPADAGVVGYNIRQGNIAYPTGIVPVDVVYNRVNYDEYTYFQGGVKCGDNILIAFTSASDSVNVMFREYSLSNFTLIREKKVEVGHANDITFDGTYVYATDTASTIKVFQYSDLSLVSEHSVDPLLHAIAIDDNGNLVGVSSQPTTTVHVYSLPDFTRIQSVPIEVTTKHGYGNITIESHEGQLFIVFSSPTSILVYDAEYNLLKAMDMPERLDRITLMESEFIAYIGNDTFMIGWNDHLSPNSAYAQNTLTKVNFKRGETNNKGNNIAQVYSPNRKIEIYVNKNYTGVYADGSVSFPFQEIQQALNNVNQEAASLILRCYAGAYEYVYSVGRIFEIVAATGTTIDDVQIKGMCIVGGYANVGQAKILHTMTNDVTAESGGHIVLNPKANYDYTTRVTTGGIIEFQGTQMPISGPSGLIILNPATYNSTNITKNTNATKVLGRVKLYGNTSIPASVTLSQEVTKYVLIEVVVNVVSRRFRGFLSPNTNTVIPISYYDSSLNHYHGVLFVGAPNGATIAPKLEMYKTTSAGVISTFTPSSAEIEINGIL